jgi:RNA polymerase sigma-70 factor (ECF subfamily)
MEQAKVYLHSIGESVTESMGALSDGELIARVSHGAEESFEEIVKRYQRPIAGYIFRIVRSYDAALDVTQEVFLKVYNSSSRYCADYKFSTWLYKIAHNAAIDHLRRNANTPQSIETENAEGAYQISLQSGALSPEQMRERSEWRTEIDKAIQTLPVGYKELIVLRHTRDLSYDEIAEVTGLPLGTVKNRLFRAREMMRKLFIEKGITGLD